MLIPKAETSFNGRKSIWCKSNLNLNRSKGQVKRPNKDGVCSIKRSWLNSSVPAKAKERLIRCLVTLLIRDFILLLLFAIDLPFRFLSIYQFYSITSLFTNYLNRYHFSPTGTFPLATCLDFPYFLTSATFSVA